MTKIFAIFVLLTLTGCMDAWDSLDSSTPKTQEAVSEDFSTSTKPFRAKVANVIFPEVHHEYVIDPTPEVIVHPFCYKTWDKPVCFDRPQVGQEERLVGNNTPTN